MWLVPMRNVFHHSIHHACVVDVPSTRTDRHMAASRICVAVRKKPCGEGEKDIVQVQSPQLVLNEPKIKYDLTHYVERHNFVFDEVFDEKCNNREVYQRCAAGLIDTVFSNGNATCFAYGQTGSGKTHTMIGRGDEPGLYACAARDIFVRAQAGKQDVTCSFYEIYGRKMFDLLNERAKLVAREDGDHVIQICGLSEHPVANVEELLRIISAGSQYRAAGSTSANADSSRSHAVLQMEVRERATQRTIGKISFIDLAGNERGSDTSDCDRKTRMEGAEINKSLLALKECIRALGMGKNHVPFRGSVLTEVLRDSFLGNSRTTMIATIASSGANSEHSLNSLRYTQRVKDLGGKGDAAAAPPPPPLPQNILPKGQQRGNAAGVGVRPGGGPPRASAADEERFAAMARNLEAQARGDPPPQAPSQAPFREVAPVPPQPRPAAKKTAQAPRPEWNSDFVGDNAKSEDVALHNIMQKRLQELDEIEQQEADEDDDDDSRTPPPEIAVQGPGAAVGSGKKAAQKIRAVHQHVSNEIQRSEEDLLAAHRKHVDTKMLRVKEEVEHAVKFDQGTLTLDEYVAALETNINKQANEIQAMKTLILRVKDLMKEEEVLSKSMTPARKGAPPARR